MSSDLSDSPAPRSEADTEAEAAGVVVMVNDNEAGTDSTRSTGDDNSLPHQQSLAIEISCGSANSIETTVSPPSDSQVFILESPMSAPAVKSVSLDKSPLSSVCMPSPPTSADSLDSAVPVTRLTRGSVSQLVSRFTAAIEVSAQPITSTPTGPRRVSRLDTKTLEAKFSFPAAAAEFANQQTAADSKTSPSQHNRSGSFANHTNANANNSKSPSLSSVFPQSSSSNLLSTPNSSSSILSSSPNSQSKVYLLPSTRGIVSMAQPIPPSQPAPNLPPPLPNQAKRSSLFSALGFSDKEKDKIKKEHERAPALHGRDPSVFASAVAAAAAAKARSQTLRRDSAIVLSSAQRADLIRSRDDSFAPPVPAHTSQLEFTELEPEEDEAELARVHKEEEEKKRKSEEESERLKEQTLSPEQIHNREEMRAKVSAEIISTEQSYIDGIQRIYQHLILPIKTELASQWDLNPQIVVGLSSNIEILVQFHSMLIIELTSGKITIPHVFLKYADYMKVYTQYLNNYSSCMNALTALRNHTKFQNFVKELKEKGKLVQDIPSYLISIVQRLPRYVLLLRELRRHTGPSQPEYEPLVDALNKIQVIATFVNEGKRQAENQSKVAEVQSRISGDFPDLVAPSRRLVKEGILTTTSSKGLFGTVKIKANHFYLFNDILLWVNEAHKYKGSIDLGAAQLDESKKSDNLLDISNAKTSITVSFADENGYNEWTKEIHQQMAILKRTRERITQRQHRTTKVLNGVKTERESLHSMITQQLGSINTAHAEENAAEESTKSTNYNNEESTRTDSGAGGDEESAAAETSTSTATAPAAGSGGKKFVVRQMKQRISRNTLKGKQAAAEPAANNQNGSNGE